MLNKWKHSPPSHDMSLRAKRCNLLDPYAEISRSIGLLEEANEEEAFPIMSFQAKREIPIKKRLITASKETNPGLIA